MNSILNNLGMDFNQLIILILTFIFGIVVVKFTVSFDLNKYLESRKETIRKKLMNACPHVELTPYGKKQIAVKCLFVSPPGTIQWQCQRCGIVRYLNDEDVKQLETYYVNNIREYNMKTKKFQKLLKKGGMV